jgi:hypothetical protein
VSLSTIPKPDVGKAEGRTALMNWLPPMVAIVFTR